MDKKTIVIGSDHGGFHLKEKIKSFLEKENYTVKDFGTFSCESTDYPVIAKEVASAVANKEFNKGILICGSGVGVSICANKIKGIRAVVCSDTCSAKYSRLHNDSNILCIGERIVGEELAFDICKIWLNTDFEAGRHLKRINMIE